MRKKTVWIVHQLAVQHVVLEICIIWLEQVKHIYIYIPAKWWSNSDFPWQKGSEITKHTSKSKEDLISKNCAYLAHRQPSTPIFPLSKNDLKPLVELEKYFNGVHGTTPNDLSILSRSCWEVVWLEAKVKSGDHFSPNYFGGKTQNPWNQHRHLIVLETSTQTKVSCKHQRIFEPTTKNKSPTNFAGRKMGHQNGRG